MSLSEKIMACGLIIVLIAFIIAVISFHTGATNTDTAVANMNYNVGVLVNFFYEAIFGILFILIGLGVVSTDLLPEVI